jgi:hypothetical protein
MLPLRETIDAAGEGAVLFREFLYFVFSAPIHGGTIRTEMGALPR